MLGYDHEILYKRGKDNVVADKFSRPYEDEGSLFVLYALVYEWLVEAKKELISNASISQLIR